MAKQFIKKITPQQSFFDFNWAELWHNRHLLLTLIKRDLQVRYKNTTLGILWVVLQPLLSAGIFTVIFANILNFGNGDHNYLVYTLIGFVFWQFFSGSVVTSSTSVYEQIAMVKKIYFPRLYLPLTIIGRGSFDWLIATALLVLTMIFTGAKLTLVGLIGYLLTMIILIIFTTGISFFVAALNARYRDFRHLIPFVIQLWFYATPVFYPTSLLSGKLTGLLLINPVAQLLSCARGAIFDGQLLWSNFGWLTLISIAVLLVSMGSFKKLETSIVDHC